MKDVDFTKMYKAAEVKLTYITKVKASHRIPIKTAEDASCLFFMVWDWATIGRNGSIDHLKPILIDQLKTLVSWILH